MFDRFYVYDAVARALYDLLPSCLRTRYPHSRNDADHGSFRPRLLGVMATLLYHYVSHNSDCLPRHYHLRRSFSAFVKNNHMVNFLRIRA